MMRSIANWRQWRRNRCVRGKPRNGCWSAESGESRVFIESYPPPPSLVVVGAAHIAVPLTKFAQELGFDVTLIDAREWFLTEERFPHVERRILAWPDKGMAQVTLDAETYLVILSHDPKFERPALKAALPHPLRYIGAIGSRKTHADRIAALRAEGVSDEGSRAHPRADWSGHWRGFAGGDRREYPCGDARRAFRAFRRLHAATADRRAEAARVSRERDGGGGRARGRHFNPSRAAEATRADCRSPGACLHTRCAPGVTRRIASSSYSATMRMPSRRRSISPALRLFATKRMPKGRARACARGSMRWAMMWPLR